MTKKNVNVRVSEEILEEFDTISAATGVSRADLVRESISFFRKHGRIFVKVSGKEIPYAELLEMSYSVLQQNPTLKEKLYKKREAVEKEEVDLGEAYDNVVRAVNYLGKEWKVAQELKLKKEAEEVEKERLGAY